MVNNYRIKVQSDSSEVVPYEDVSIPIFVSLGRLSHHSGMEMITHWHEEIEYIMVLEGKMTYDISGNKVELKPGDAVIVNSRRLHRGIGIDKQTDCVYMVLVFHTKLFASVDAVYSRFIEPITENRGLDYILLGDDKESEAINRNFRRIYDLYYAGDSDFVLKAISSFAEIWAELHHKLKDKLGEYRRDDDRDVISQKAMASYIYKNYGQKLDLDSIARAGGVCRSKCCRIFKKYFGKSPIDFLAVYRMEKSLKLLRETDMSITDIALSCGFGSASYYTKSFREHYGFTPMEHRKTITGSRL